MFEHLVDLEPPSAVAEELTLFDEASPADIIDAQVSTADWLESVGAPTSTTAKDSDAPSLAQHAFTSLIANPDIKASRDALRRLETPAAVRHLVGMLTAYDWDFVQQAKELRGYAVAQILEETKHPEAKIRLRALEMLGKVTEVALFTDRLEVKKTDMTEKDLDERIKEKLNRFMGVVDANPTDIPSAAT